MISQKQKNFRWEPKTELLELVQIMVKSDWEELNKEVSINKKDKIYVAGHAGMVGSAIVRCFEKNGFNNLIYRTHHQLDLLDQKKTLKFFEKERPDCVVIAAAKVGGIFANSTLKPVYL